MKAIDRAEDVVYKILMAIGGVFMLACVAVVTVNVIYRAISATPITGYYELTGWLAAYFVAIGIAVTSLRKQHVRVDILIGRLNIKSRIVFEYIAHGFDLILAGFLCVAGFQYAAKMMAVGEATQTLKLAIWPGRFCWALAMFLIVVIKIIQIVRTNKYMHEDEAERIAALEEVEEDIDNNSINEAGGGV